MGSASRCVVFILFTSVMFLLFNFELLEAALSLTGHERKADVTAVARDAGLCFLSKFRVLLGRNHHQSQSRSHQRSSTAPAPAPAPGPALVHEARSSVPTPLLRTPQSSRTPLAHQNHIAPARSAGYRREDGGNARLPKTAIAVLSVFGASLLVLGVFIVISLWRSRKLQKGCSKPFKLFCHGSRVQRSPGATRKVSSHPSPDLLYQENYPSLKQPSENNVELIRSDYTVKDCNALQSDEAKSFHSIPCSPSSNGSIPELPLQICVQATTDLSPSSPHIDNSPSDSSYKSLSPDFIFHFSSKCPTTISSTCFSLPNTSCCSPQKLNEENTEVNYREIPNNDFSRPMTPSPKVEQADSKFQNHPSEHNPHSYHTETTISATKTSTASNREYDLNSNESTKSSTEGTQLQKPDATSASKPPPPPPPPNKSPPNMKGKNFGQPPPPPLLPLQIQVSKNGSPLPRLKPLHWDKIRAAPNRSMVWNDLGSNSFEFELDEHMIKSLFAYNCQGLAKIEDAKSMSVSSSNHVIEHHKLQNTTILLKTLNASTKHVCTSISEGTGLSVQQLEALVKMKPTKEEEEKLLHYDGDIDKLDAAENFVKEVLSIPMAFSRMEAMLYKETFEDEVAHVKMSFAMIEGACTELRSSKLFLRLLEAVLKTGNRMNVGTVRGCARAFKLDALLKLADIRGADGKTTLLHFVVQEMARSQGLKASEKLIETPRTNHATAAEREDYWAIGTEVVSELSNELGNVKKAASIDLDTLINSISNLSLGMAQLSNLIEKDLPNDDKNKSFLQCMKFFLQHAENIMQELKVDEGQVLLHVKELIEYYYGEVGKDESNLLHIFVIVKDFLGLLDRVCREMRGSKHIQPLNLVLPFR